MTIVNDAETVHNILEFSLFNTPSRTYAELGESYTEMLERALEALARLQSKAKEAEAYAMHPNHLNMR